MIVRLPKLFMKDIFVMSAVLILLSAVIISLDKHYTGSSSSCVICKVRSCLSDDVYSYHLNYYPVEAYYYGVEYVAVSIFFFVVHLKNRAPPESLSFRTREQNNGVNHSRVI
jgi:hypothetical protein